MSSVIRFLQDILGYFMEKMKQSTRIVILGSISATILFLWGWRIYIDVVAAVLWIISIFLFGLVIYNIIKDRSRRA